MTSEVTDFPNVVGDFKTGDRVLYVPNHANGNTWHEDCRAGMVSSVNDRFVFVRFDENVNRLGWDGATSQACDPTNLTKLG